MSAATDRGRGPANRLASVDGVAHAFLYLASDEAKYVSGINLIVDGALTAQTYDVPGSQQPMRRFGRPRRNSGGAGVHRLG